LSVVAKDPRVRHADHFGATGAVMARLSVAQTGLADLVDDARRARDWRWTHDAFVARPFLRLISRAERGESTFDSDDDDITDLFAAFTARSADPPAGNPPRWLRDAFELARDGWHAGLTVRDVAASAGVHPVYLARCMRRWYGTTTAEELRRARLSRAVGLLTRPATTVSVAAHDVGFSDEPHLCREFSRATGVTPGRFRGLAHLVAALGASCPADDRTPR
jgi:AraC family transcriptional regulator